MNKRILLFVHYNMHKKFSNYCEFLLSSMRETFQHIIFISNSELSSADESKIRTFTDTFVLRENKGYDFGAWKDVILTYLDMIKGYDSLTLMNDTCFGPLYDIEQVFNCMESRKIDFWGITNYKKDKKKKIPEHLQSYFLTFNKSIVHSPCFIKYWQDVKYFSDIKKVIHKYEIKMTQYFLNHNFNYDSFIDTSHVVKRYKNFANLYPDFLCENRTPFLKVKLFIESGEHSGTIFEKLKKYSDYPVSLIEKHFSYYFPPEITLPYFSSYKILEDNISSIQKPSCAIIINCSDKSNIKDLITALPSNLYKKIFINQIDFSSNELSFFLFNKYKYSEFDYTILINDTQDIDTVMAFCSHTAELFASNNEIGLIISDTDKINISSDFSLIFEDNLSNTLHPLKKYSINQYISLDESQIIMINNKALKQIIELSNLDLLFNNSKIIISHILTVIWSIGYEYLILIDKNHIHPKMITKVVFSQIIFKQNSSIKQLLKILTEEILRRITKYLKL